MKDSLATAAVPMVMTAVFMALAVAGLLKGWSFLFILGVVGAIVYSTVMMMLAIRIWRR